MGILRQWWFSLNYRYCMSQRYLVMQQGLVMDAIEWERRAWSWQQKWRGA